MKTIRNMILLIALFLLIPFIPIHASSDVYVEDTYGALSQEEVDELNAYAAQIADQYEFGVYARIIEKVALTRFIFHIVINSLCSL